jgi:hypothetical protein
MYTTILQISMFRSYFEQNQASLLKNWTIVCDLRFFMSNSRVFNVHMVQDYYAIMFHKGKIYKEFY